MKKWLLSLACCFSFAVLLAQDSIRCYPTNWWTGMKWNKVQVMLHGTGIGSATATLRYPGVQLLKVNKVENENYLFLDLAISASAKPGTLPFVLTQGGTAKTVRFELKAKPAANGRAYAQGVTSRDFIYLIMPDRFSNGDTSNDRVPGMRDQTLNRDTVFNRHGGDFRGIINHLDYLQSLGVTTLWLNPVLENDMPRRTEHGYAFTDHYTVDRRLGGDKGYLELVDSVHKRGMKVIQDAVYNHVGSYHLTVLDRPMKDWLHEWPSYTNTTYRDQTLFDPYASPLERKKMADGWFTKEMPDLNQNNPYVANFLIQHALWTVAEFGVDGWRIDTYAYNDLEFMNRCNKALTDEFPQITMFGETWVHGVPNQSYFAQNVYDIPFKSNLQAVTDFQTLWGIQDAMTKDFSWTDGAAKLYTILAQDFVYRDPMRNVIFLDNHDLSRFYSVIGEHQEKYKSSLSWLLTCRGIPQLYYGSELATTGFTSPNDGYVRLDFPGGWPGDTANKFELSGRTVKDHEIWRHVHALANYRKTSTALNTGKMMQYVPEDGLYVYFRYDVKQTVIVAMNTSPKEKTLSFGKYAERTSGFANYLDVLTKQRAPIKDITVQPHQTLVLELQP